MKISLTGFLAVLSTVGFALAQYDYYYDSSGDINNNNNNDDDEGSNFNNLSHPHSLYNAQVDQPCYSCNYSGCLILNFSTRTELCKVETFQTNKNKLEQARSDYLLALLVGLFFIERFVKRKYNITGSNNFVNLRP